MSMRRVQDARVAGLHVLVRGSLNVPIEDGTILDDFRLKKLLPTLEYLTTHGARVILVGHRSGDSSESLMPVYGWLKNHFRIIFVQDLLSARHLVDDLAEGSILFAENIRRYPGENENDPAFAESLASLADIYVMDDFTAAHRDHASIVGVPRLLKTYAGFQFQEEYAYVSEALHPPSPSVLIVAGAKFASKLPLALRYLERFDRVFVGGAIANPFFAARGLSVGSSLLPQTPPDLTHALSHPRLYLPIDARVADSSGGWHVSNVEDIRSGEVMVDAGPKTEAMLGELVSDARFVLWVGPLGSYEDGFTKASKSLAEAIGKTKARSIVGGGDTGAVINMLGMRDQFSFISTAGGALLTFLEGGTLPGVTAVEESPM